MVYIGLFKIVNCFMRPFSMVLNQMGFDDNCPTKLLDMKLYTYKSERYIHPASGEGPCRVAA